MVIEISNPNFHVAKEAVKRSASKIELFVWLVRKCSDAVPSQVCRDPGCAGNPCRCSTIDVTLLVS